jgi:hypothetical protein
MSRWAKRLQATSVCANAATAGSAEIHHANGGLSRAAQLRQAARQTRCRVDLADAGVQHLGAGLFEQAAGFLRQCHHYQRFRHSAILIAPGAGVVQW